MESDLLRLSEEALHLYRAEFEKPKPEEFPDLRGVPICRREVELSSLDGRDAERYKLDLASAYVGLLASLLSGIAEKVVSLNLLQETDPQEHDAVIAIGVRAILENFEDLVLLTRLSGQELEMHLVSSLLEWAGKTIVNRRSLYLTEDGAAEGEVGLATLKRLLKARQKHLLASGIPEWKYGRRSVVSAEACELIRREEKEAGAKGRENPYRALYSLLSECVHFRGLRWEPCFEVSGSEVAVRFSEIPKDYAAFPFALLLFLDALDLYDSAFEGKRAKRIESLRQKCLADLPKAASAGDD